MTSTLTPPDLSARPLKCEVERLMQAAPAELYWAWTEQFDRWLAEPGTLISQGEVDTVFHFETRQGGDRQAYYGRFLALTPEQRVEMTWVSPGTQGLETIVTIALEPEGPGTRLRLTQTGFSDEAFRSAHEQAWPALLATLDAQLS